MVDPHILKLLGVAKADFVQTTDLKEKDAALVIASQLATVIIADRLEEIAGLLRSTRVIPPIGDGDIADRLEEIAGLLRLTRVIPPIGDGDNV